MRNVIRDQGGNPVTTECQDRRWLPGQAARVGAWVAMLVLSLAVSLTAYGGASGQRTFASPEMAADALAKAWHNGSRAALLEIFGPAGIKLVVSGDVVAEKAVRARLASAYDSLHRIDMDDANHAHLIIGREEFPFPIPLVRQAGAWRFDTKAGEEEILVRRIGRNELNAIRLCRTYVQAQREYATSDSQGDGLHAFATSIVSTEGSHDGLYWPAKAGEKESPLGPLVARATAAGYGMANAGARTPFHGYYFRILTRQGADAPGGAMDYIDHGHMVKGFALIAFPAKYGSSGIMTFVVNQYGIIYEKDLGPRTEVIARQMTAYDPDPTWKTP
jgi:Protein of unknown function (DUF2950)